MLLARAVRSDSVGLGPATLVVIEANGDIEQVDSLKSAYDGAAGTGLNIQAHTLERALWHPLTAARQLGLDALCQTCRSCALRQVCGGGHFAHRYHRGSGFLNPSVYGPDLAKLISHIGLSVVALPMILITFFLSLSGRFPAHRRVARFTFPIWLYVSVTGVIVYAMLAVYADDKAPKEAFRASQALRF